MKILIAPFSRQLRDQPGKQNAKNYPWPRELVELLIQNEHEVIQVGCFGEERIASNVVFGSSFQELAETIQQCDTFIAVDSYLQHYGWFLKKRGIVLWGQSDPNIFGHSFHLNLLKDRKYIRPDPFNVWEARPMIEEAFVSPREVLNALNLLQ